MAGKAGECSRLRRFGSLLGGGSLVLFGFASCGSTTISPATVYLTSTIGPNTTGATPCDLGTVTNQLEIGSSASGVETGTQGTMITCSVTSSGSGFAVDITVDAEGGSFAVSGTMPSSGTANTGVTGSLDYGLSGAPILYSESSDCSVVMANGSGGFPGFDPANGPAIAPGRVWAQVTCNAMTVSMQQGVCQGILLFRLENCLGSLEDGG
jgi:hypothetical protein